jgi:hypothetical protein
MIGSFVHNFNLNKIAILNNNQTEILSTQLIDVFQVNFRLEHVHLFNCLQLDDNILDSIANNCFCLQSLSITGSSVTDTGIIKVASACKLLKELDLQGCFKVTTEGLHSVKTIASSLCRLVHVHQVNIMELDKIQQH